MPILHTIEQGETTIGLSEKHGHLADTIWNDGANASLKEKRKDMNVLLPGDVLTIPDKRVKEVSKPDGQKHRFKRKGIPAKFRLQVFDCEEPRANQDYQLIIDGKVIKGKTDRDGILEEFVPANAKQGELITGPDEFRLIIDFGFLDPISEISGVQKRLNNLGYVCGEPNGELNEATRDALADFQHRFGLDVSGDADKKTIDKLEEVHDGSKKFPEPKEQAKGGGK